MRLLFQIKSMNTRGGGAERVLSEVLAGLASRGHEIALVTYDRPGDPSFYPLDPRIERIDLGIGAPGRSARLGETIRRMRALRALVVPRRPDVAIGFMHSGYVPLAAALAGSGVPLVASEHSSWPHFASRPLQAALLRATPPLVRAVTIMSPRTRDGFPSVIRRAMTVVPNPAGTAPSGLARLAPPAGVRRTLLAVGSLKPEKNHRTLVAAFSLLAARFPEWDLVVVGEGELRPALEEQVRGLGLSGRVRLPGLAKDVGAAYRAAQLFAIPSLYESFGLVTVEAMAHGLPAVGFADCPGTNELIVPGVNGLLAAGADRVSALADALGRLMEDDHERQRLQPGALATAAPYLPERAVDAWERLLTAVRSGARWNSRARPLPG